MKAQDLWNNLIVCGYFTPNGYATEAERLARSLKRFGVPYDLSCRYDMAESDWKTVVRKKPRILKEFRERYHNRPILFVDVDAIFNQDPRRALPNTWRAEIPAMSIHKFRREMESSGTIILAPDTRADDLLDRWMREDENHGYKLSQPQDVLKFVKGINKNLAPEWCWIFDLSPQYYGNNIEPIIIHLQASREYRKDKPTPKHLLQNRRDILLEIDQ